MPLLDSILSRILPAPKLQQFTSLARTDSAPEARADCGPGGCGGLPGVGYGEWDWGTPRQWANRLPGMSKEECDVLYWTSALARRIVDLLINDCLRSGGLPTLSGEEEELTPCIAYLEQKGFFTAAKQAMIYARLYGGGGVVCFVQDGRRNDEEVDTENIRDIRGFYALPRWYLVPVDNGSSRIDAAWYGQRIGRPEMYSVTPINVSSGTFRYSDELQQSLNEGGNRFHRSRIVPWMYCPEMDLQMARQWNGGGWGPGILESCLDALLIRRSGMMRVSDMMNSAVYNVLSVGNLLTAQSTPSGGSPLREQLEGMKRCLAFTGDGIPMTAIMQGMTLEPKSHNLSNIDKMIDAQRKYLLDVAEYPEVVLFSSGGSNGLSGDENAGQWQAYYNKVASTQQSWCWEAGSFGGGIKQAVILAQFCKTGPTNGKVDLLVKADWPFMGISSEKDRAETRLKDAQARNLESITFGIRGEAMARLDPTVQRIFPALDVDDGVLPSFSNGGIQPLDQPEASLAKSGSTPAQAATAMVAEAGAEEPTQDAGPAAPLVLPSDIATEVEIANALKMTKRAFRNWINTTSVTTFPTPPGTRGGHRYSMGEVLKAWNSMAQTRRTDVRGGKSRLDGAFLVSYQDVVRESELEADAWLDARIGMDQGEMKRQAIAIYNLSTNLTSADLERIVPGKPAGKEPLLRARRLASLPSRSWTLQNVRDAVWAAKVIGRLLGSVPSMDRDCALLAWGYDPNK